MRQCIIGIFSSKTVQRSFFATKMDGDGSTISEVVLEASSIRQTNETSVEGRRKNDDIPSKHRYINSPERYRYRYIHNTGIVTA